MGYTPALGAHWLTPLYDSAIAHLTRERVWRGALVNLIDAKPGDRILDIGCGTGSLVVALAAQADVIGVDPDAAVLVKARAKARNAGVNPRFVEGFLDASLLPADWRPNKITSSLVLHQTPLDVKSSILATARDLLTADGALYLADYGRQSTSGQRFLFRNTVQRLDGVENTQLNADGAIEDLLERLGFTEPIPVRLVPTLTGTIAIWRTEKRN